MTGYVKNLTTKPVNLIYTERIEINLKPVLTQVVGV